MKQTLINKMIRGDQKKICKMTGLTEMQVSNAINNVHEVNQDAVEDALVEIITKRENARRVREAKIKKMMAHD